MILPKASSTLDKIASSHALFSIWCTTAGGKSPPHRLLPYGQYAAPPSAGAQTPRPQRPGSYPTHSRAICLLHRRSIITLIHLFIFILNTVFVIDHGDLWITPKSPESKAIPKPSACGRIVDDLWMPVDNLEPQKLSTSLPTDFHNVIHGVVLIFVHS